MVLIRRAGQRRWVAAALVAALVAGCSSPTPQDTQAPEPSAPLQASSRPTADATLPSSSAPASSATPLAFSNYPSLPPLGAIRSVTWKVKKSEEIQINHFDSEGPLVVFSRADPADYGAVYLTDLAAGTSRVIYRSPAKREIWFPAITGNRIVWLEFFYPTDAAHPAQHWWLKTLDLGTGRTRTLADAENPTFDPHSPGFGGYLSAHDDRVVYGLGKDDKWTLIVRSLETGKVERRIPLARPFVDAAVTKANVAWTEGTPNPDTDSVRDMRLMVATAKGAKPLELARYAYWVFMDGDRVVWLADEETDRSGGGPPTAPRIFSSTISNPLETPLSRPVDGNPTLMVHRPDLGDGMVVWWEDQRKPTGTDFDSHLIVWDEATGKAFILEEKRAAQYASVAGGWITWMDSDHPPVVKGIPISEIRKPGP